jgi:hypothetical protein|tara:strand:+ start:1208 stop:1312 length:105 start_codon:yes stop_codon:yes gene_type:complete
MTLAKAAQSIISALPLVAFVAAANIAVCGLYLHG